MFLPQIKFLHALISGYPHLSPIKFLHRDKLPASNIFVPRHYTRQLRFSLSTMTFLLMPSGLYRDYARPQSVCTMTAKTRAMLHSLRPYLNHDKESRSSGGLHSFSNAYMAIPAGR